eukprot:GILJ01003407.1.p1 GENE.GILJ01003407.1~~GILJ01003407.1.p1  ORF type:complete len:594 (-),score=58.29 GILJ01003407.1:163-1944(-)
MEQNQESPHNSISETWEPSSDSTAHVYVFGQNAYGELCVGDLKERCEPTLASFFDTLCVSQVAAGNEHTLVVTEEGEVYTCGFNGSGQLGHGHNANITAPQVVEALMGKKVISLASANGCEHFVALTDSGEVYTCGYNNYGQLGLGNTTNLQIPTLVQALATKKIVNVSCSYYHTVFVCENDEVYSCGRNDSCQLAHGTNGHEYTPRLIESLRGKRVIQTACGLHHTLFVTDKGEVYSCGLNDYGQLGHGDNNGRSTPTRIEALRGQFIIQVACGYYHSVCRTDQGQVFAFGRNGNGQVGLGSNAGPATALPSKVTFGRDAKPIVKVACGCYHTIALTEAGDIYTFGRGNHGQLGHGNTTDYKAPKWVESLSGRRVVEIAGGFYHTIVLSAISVQPTSPAPSLSADMRKLINSSARSDVTFIVEGKQVHAHRCIIMSRCRPLEEQIEALATPSVPQQSSRRKQHVTLPITTGSHQAFVAFIEYLYTDMVETLDPGHVEIEYAMDLLSFADTFKVDRLKRLCEAAIQKSIREENVALTLRTAHERQALQLKKTCMDFILRHFGKVIGTVAFTELPPQILQEVLFAASKRGVRIG